MRNWILLTAVLFCFSCKKEYGFKANGNKQYVVTSSAPVDKYYKVSFLPYLELYNYEKNEFSFTGVEYGYLSFVLNNAACFDANDQIVLHRDSETGYNGYGTSTHMGCYSSTGSTFAKVPSGDWYIEWHVTKNNITNIYHDTINLNPGDSLTYLIEY
ncbi:MAG: hypothetical protein IPG07_17235 [Crocinitomicaceae bacterium]|nr:hypothetical protein [Crocinitomicaceae bacterium]